MGNQYRVARVTRELSGAEQPGPTASSSGPPTKKQQTTTTGAEKPSTRENRSDYNTYLSDSEQRDLSPEEAFRIASERRNGMVAPAQKTNAPAEATSATVASTAGDTADNPEVVDLEGLFPEEKPGPRVTPDAGMVENLGQDSANSLAGAVENELYPESTFQNRATDRFGNEVPTAQDIYAGVGRSDPAEKDPDFEARKAASERALIESGGINPESGFQRPASNVKEAQRQSSDPGSLNPTKAGASTEGAQAAIDSTPAPASEEAGQQAAGAVLSRQGKRPTAYDVFNAAGLV
jgi:hypothetical protein